MWSKIPPIRWIADAMTILSAARIDWDQLLEVSLRIQAVPPVRDALGYIVQTFGAPVPEHVISSLHRVAIRPAERRAYQRLIDPLHRQTPWEVWSSLYWRHSQNRPDQPRWKRWASFPRYLQHHWNEENLLGLLRGATHWIQQRYGIRRRQEREPAARSGVEP